MIFAELGEVIVDAKVFDRGVEGNGMERSASSFRRGNVEN